MKRKNRALPALALSASLLAAAAIPSWGADVKPVVAETEAMTKGIVESSKVIIDPMPKFDQQVPSTAISMDRALELARAALNIPDSMRLEYSNYYNNGPDDQGTWSFSWVTTEGGEQSSINVGVNATTGAIRHFNRWKPGYYPQDQGQPPTISEAEALNRAEAFISALQPEEAKKVVRNLTVEARIEMRSDVPPEKIAGMPYQFRFDRQENGILYPNNGFSLGVNRLTGEIQEYNFMWENVVFPSAEGMISASEAKTAYLNGMGFGLTYRQEYTPEGPQTRLVYMPQTEMWVMVDARTEKLVDYSGQELTYTVQGVRFDVPAVNATPVFNLGSPLPRLEVGEKGLPLAKAVTVIDGLVKNMDDFNSFDAYLERTYPEGKKKAWNLNWSMEEKVGEGYQYKNVSVRVNAQTGAIEQIGFNGNTGDYPESYYDKKGEPGVKPEAQPIVPMEEAEKTAIAFMAGMQPDLLRQTLLVRPVKPPEAKDGPYYNYYFRFVRQVNGVNYPMNSLWVNVNASTGKVMDYGMNWDLDGALQVNQAIPLEQAMEMIWEKVEMEPVYQRFSRWDYQTEREIRSDIILVYRVKNFAPMILDATTGEWVGGYYGPKY